MYTESCLEEYKLAETNPPDVVAKQQHASQLCGRHEVVVAVVKPTSHLRGSAPIHANDHYAVPQLYAYYLFE